MKVCKGEGTTQYGPGVVVVLSGDEVFRALVAYMACHGVQIFGSQTTTLNGDECGQADVYVDPTGFVMVNGTKWDGRTGLPDGWVAEVKV